MRVFIVQETKHNVQAARQYGELHVLLSNADVLAGTESMIEKLYRRLDTVRFDDYILCVGDPLAIGLALTVALDITDGFINVLKWDKERCEYKKEKVEL